MYFDLRENREKEREDLRRFIHLYNYRNPEEKPPPPGKWEERAEAWEKEFRTEKGDKRRSIERVKATLAFLWERGALGPESEVVDVGCGPGRFVAGFAEGCRGSLGIDISPRMTEYAERYARELGLTNTRFLTADFQELDVDEAGLAGRFDLAFCSITPAASGRAGAEKLMKLSREWCFTSNFVSAENHLDKRIAKELFDKMAPPKWDAHWFYALFNMLFLAGYFPEVRYYSRHKEGRTPADRASARRHMQWILPGAEQTAEREDQILRWLEKEADEEGMVTESSDFTYAWMLWNIKDRVDRQVYPTNYPGLSPFDV